MAGGTEKDIINSLILGAEEIKQLRMRIAIQDAQLRIVTVFEAALGLKPMSVGMGEDIAWRLKKHAEAIQIDLDRKPDPKERSDEH